MDKRYLRALAGRGVPVVPTAWVERGDARPLAGILAAHGWRDAVVKPVVSASAHATWRTGASASAGADAGAEAEARFRAQCADGAVMVQPFLEVIRDGGEWSLVFVDGAFSHAVRKRPAPGDFRVQQEHGGSAEPAAAPAALVAHGRAALAAAQAAAGSASGALYARVDGCETDAGFLLMELELLEPSLFLGADDGAAARLAAAIGRRLGERVSG
jgi:glutathione synthase/RimK-type ligase-like ATP-grasp enzyme